MPTFEEMMRTSEQITDAGYTNPNISRERKQAPGSTGIQPIKISNVTPSTSAGEALSGFIKQRKINNEINKFNGLGNGEVLNTMGDINQNRPNELFQGPFTGSQPQAAQVNDNKIFTNGKDYYATTLDKESSGNYKAVNRFNYLGGYQMGAQALNEAGLVKRGITNKELDNPNNWLNGLSKEKFLNNSKLQDSAVRTYTNKQKKYLGNKYTEASMEDRGALLAAAHLIGPSATLKDINQVDANGVSGQDRFNIFRGTTGY